MQRLLAGGLVLLSLIVGQAQGATPSRQSQPNGLHVVILRDRIDDGQRMAVVAQDFFYCYPVGHRAGELYRVPRGYITDFASIPPPFRPLIAQFGRWAEATVVHDYLYAIGEPQDELRRATRAHVDRVFLYHAGESQVRDVTRHTMYRAIRLFSAGAFARENSRVDRWGDPATGQTTTPPKVLPPALVAIKFPCGRLETDPDGVRTEYPSEPHQRAVTAAPA